MRLSLLLRSVSSLALASSAAAQTLYSISGPAATVTEQTGPSAGACGYPAGPLVSAFPTLVPYACPTPGPFPPPPALIGDVGVARGGNVVWATSGAILTAYTPAGAVVNSFALPAALVPGFLPISGLGVDGATGMLWLCSGAAACAIFPPPAPGCAAPVIAIPPFPLPAAAAPYTDIDWDPSTGSLFASGAPGLVANVLPGGAPGPFGIFPAGAPCGLATLQGIAVDHAAAPGTGTVYVTDGALVARTMAPGIPAPPTFYSPVPCFPVLAPPSSGLAFSAHGIRFGIPTPAAGIALSSIGQSVSPNPAFAVAVSGVPAASLLFVYYSASFNCPPLPLGANLVHIGVAPPPVLLGSAAVAAAGTVTFGAALPPALPIPGGVYLQAVDVTGGGAISMSNGLEISFARP